MQKIHFEIDVVISWKDKQTVVAQGCENKSCMKQFICCNCSKLQGVSRGKNRHPEDSKKSKMLWRKLSWRKALQQIKKAKKMWKEVHDIEAPFQANNCKPDLEKLYPYHFSISVLKKE